MRILHVSDCYLPRVGGIELHLRDLISHQRAAGHDAQVATVTPPDCDDPPDPDWVERMLPEPPGSRRAVEQLERRLCTRPVDVVHIHVSILSPFATIAAQRCCALGLPILVTVHSMWTGLGPLPGAAVNLLGLRRKPICWSAVSERAADPLRRLLGDQVSVSVLPNAIDPDSWRAADPTGGEWLQPRGAQTIVSVLRLTRVKRTLPLARLLHQVQQQRPADSVRAVVIGDGPQRRPLERYMRRHRMDEWVELPGRLERARIRQHLLGAAIFLAPAARESFGIAALEARAVGVPVVASSRSGVGEFITSGVDGLLGETDADLVRHVVRLLADDSLRNSIAVHNRMVPPAYDWPSAVEHADLLYTHAYRTSRQGHGAQPSALAVGSLQ